MFGYAHPHFHWWIHRHRRKRVIPVLTIGGVAVELSSEETIIMATTINVGQSLPLEISYLDQNGQKMAVQPIPDSAPQWSQTSPSTESLTQSADGNTASVVGLATGDDTVSLSLSVGGKNFSASLGVSVVSVAPSQTLTSIEIVPGTPTP